MAAAGEHSSHVPEVPQEPQLQDQQQQQQPQHRVDVGAPTLSLRAKRRLRKQQERADSKRQKTSTISPPTPRATIPAEVAQITSESAAVQPDIAVSCSVCEWSLIEAATDDRVPSISIIIPVHNAEPWLDECLHSIATQRHRGRVQVSLYNDRSTVCCMSRTMSLGTGRLILSRNVGSLGARDRALASGVRGAFDLGRVSFE